MPEVILPCPYCGGTDLGCWEFVVCKDCEMRGPRDADESAAIAAWNALPRMSTIIAWQFQAAGAALQLQRLMDVAQAMREAQWAWGKLIGVNTDMLITPAINQAACTMGDAEDAFDDLLASYRREMNFVK